MFDYGFLTLISLVCLEWLTYSLVCHASGEIHKLRLERERKRERDELVSNCDGLNLNSLPTADSASRNKYILKKNYKCFCLLLLRALGETLNMFSFVLLGQGGLFLLCC